MSDASTPTFAQRLVARFGRDAPYATRDAFSQLYERSHTLVFRYIYGLQSRSLLEAEDLTAETFFRAWRARRRFHGSEEAAIGWLFQIARHLVIDTYRRQRRQREEPISTPLPDLLRPTPEEHALAQEQAEHVWQLLASLSLEHRELMVLRYILGWQVRAIAQHVQQPENTVSVTIRRILVRLREQSLASERRS